MPDVASLGGVKSYTDVSRTCLPRQSYLISCSQLLSHKLLSRWREIAGKLSPGQYGGLLDEKYGAIVFVGARRFKWDILLRNNPNMLNFSYSVGINERLSLHATRYGVKAHVCVRVREPGASTCVLRRVHLPAFDAFLSCDNNSAGRDESVRAAPGHDLDFNSSAVRNWW